MRRLAPLLLALLTLKAAAQEKLVESIEVRVVNVDVVVTDGRGRPITGLTKDDFEILENGKPQKITNLYEVTPLKEGETPDVALARKRDGAPPLPPVEMRARRLVLFVDNSSLPVFKRLEVLRALDKYVEREMRSSDETTIVTWNPGLRIVLPFTSDRDELRAAIRKMSERVNSGASDMVAQQTDHKHDCLEYLASAKLGNLTYGMAWNMCKNAIDGYAEEMGRNARTVLDAMRLTSTTLAGVEGKKVMVIAGAHLPERPGLELTMWAYKTFEDYLRGVNPMAAMHDTQHNSTVYSIEKFARQANADGVTVYVIDAADSRDLTSADQTTMPELDLQFTSFANTAQAYQTIASLTGGLLVSSNNFDTAFNAVAKDLDHYYSLGYKPSDDAKSGKGRSIVVKAKNGAYRIRSRRSYMPKSSEEQISDSVVANLYHSSMRSEWPIELAAGKPERDGDRFRIPMVITIPPTLTLLPQEGRLTGGFDVYVAVGNDTGAMSKVAKTAQPVKVPASAEQNFRSKAMTFDLPLLVRPGTNTISIAVVDEISNTTGFARATIMAR